jgi:hypothetical protein
LLAEATRPAADVLPGIGSTTQRISSDRRDRATRDPLVQRLKEAFEGTIVNVVARSRTQPVSGEGESVQADGLDNAVGDAEME